MIAMMKLTLSIALAGLLAACTAPVAVTGPGDEPVGTGGSATRILDTAMAAKLRGSSGITLQWISWDWRGQVEVTQPDDVIFIHAVQDSADAPAGVRDLSSGRVEMDGRVTEVGPDYFLFDGTIRIKDAPDTGRDCLRKGPMTFLITQNRRYWRLQDMEACGDGLTDYVDIYF